ncbi:aminomethyl transferase family protein [Novosphingobium sp. SG720]|uniref:aminomethyl transferase family protein n=1 Tax=Novosphingobium sp. SG720 TaxID=2586998 RepID=UPI0014477B72|nr:aminomethyl transferase family protein [Novosphingobium sp. SG720]NKJ44508.1 glycine cleavage system aminomethyltransferase T [Novosphingobium sp. SG720]
MLAPQASPFNRPAAVPYYPQYGLFSLFGGYIRQWEYNGWQVESLSWKRTCYIHAGLSGMGQITYRGPDAERFLAETFVNNFSRFQVGRAKHAVACDEDGLIAGHGVLQRRASDDFCLYVAGLWAPYRFSQFSGDVEQIISDDFLFQVAGPTSLATLEAAAGESLRDIGFLRYRQVRIAGHSVQIMRLGMAGTLAFEVHGPFAHGPEIYDAILRAGEPHGIEPLGWQTFQVNHVEGGFPQQFWTFSSSMHWNQGWQQFMAHMPFAFPDPIMAGSIDPADWRARCRTPTDVGWQGSVQFDHDFTGRAALCAQFADSTRTVVTLEWNAEDVANIYRSYLAEGEPCKFLEIPVSPANRGVCGHADHVMAGDRRVGVSSGTVYSYHFRKVISHATIDRDQAVIGNQVLVHWGDFGKRIEPIRATVARFPYLTEGRNQEIDPTKI